MNKQEQAWAYTEKQLANDTSGHSLDHIRRVVHHAKQIAATETVDNEAVVLGAILHEALDDKLVADAAQAKSDFTALLADLALTETQQNILWEVVTKTSFSKSVGQNWQLTKEAQIVQDADRLDAIGAIGIGRVFYYGGSKGHLFVKPSQEVTESTSYQRTNVVLDHFDEKLLKLKDMMNTPEGHRLATIRHDRMVRFLAEFNEEWGEQA